MILQEGSSGCDHYRFRFRAKSLAVEAKEVLLAEDGIDVRVVSMPCMDIFEEQSEEYKAKVLPKNVRKRVAVEALSGLWMGSLCRT